MVMFLKSVIISLASAGYQIIIIINIIIMSCMLWHRHSLCLCHLVPISSLDPDQCQWNVQQLIQILGTPSCLMAPCATLRVIDILSWQIIYCLKAPLSSLPPCPRSPPITLFYVPQIVRKLDTWEMIELWQFSENSFGAADISCHALADVWVTK